MSGCNHHTTHPEASQIIHRRFALIASLMVILPATMTTAQPLGRWAVDFDAEGEAERWQGRGGDWEFGDGVLRQNKADEYRNILLRSGDVADFDLSVRCRMLEVHEAYEAAGYLVVAFRARGINNFYSVHLRSIGDVNLLEWASPPSPERRVWQLMGRAHNLGVGRIPPNEWWRVEVRATGLSLHARAYPDGEPAPDWQVSADLSRDLPIDHAGDSAHVSGAIGLGTSNARVEFADLVVDARPSALALQRHVDERMARAQRLLNAAGEAEAETAREAIRALDELAAQLGALEELTEAQHAQFMERLEALDAPLAEARLAVLLARGGLRAACTWADYVDLPQYKANLHCHTRHSDGALFCDEMAARYEELGYHILAMTDHDAYGDQDGGVLYPHFQNDQEVHDWDGDGVLHPEREYRSGVEAYVRDYDAPAPPWVPRNWKLNRPGEFVVLNGMESSFGHQHTNVIEPPTGAIPRPREGYGFIDWTHGNDGIVFVVHPSNWNDTPERILDHPEMRKVDGIEVMNGFLARDNRQGDNPDGAKGFAEPLWDACLDAGKRLWGFANDDAHNGNLDHFAGPASAWNMVWARELTKDAVMDSLRNGAFYASCGIEVDRVEITAERLTVRSPNATHIAVIGDGGQTLLEVEGGTLTYELTGRESWVRVKLWNDTICYPEEDARYVQQAWLQPIMLDSLLDAPGE